VIFKIYCDMDGVLTNLEGEAKKIDPLNIGFEDKSDQNITRIWKEIDKYGISLWENLKWINDSKILWRFIKPYNPIILSAAPSKSRGKIHTYALIGKQKWIMKNLGEEFLKTAKIVERREKKEFSDKNSILIDDMETNIKEWNNRGGIAILHKNSKKTIDALKKIL